jgi:hypothetical protein
MRLAAFSLRKYLQDQSLRISADAWCDTTILSAFASPRSHSPRLSKCSRPHDSPLLDDVLPVTSGFKLTASHRQRHRCSPLTSFELRCQRRTTERAVCKRHAGKRISCLAECYLEFRPGTVCLDASSVHCQRRRPSLERRIVLFWTCPLQNIWAEAVPA